MVRFCFVFLFCLISYKKPQESKLTHFQGNGSTVLIYRAIIKSTFLENVNYIYVCLILPCGTDMLAWVGSVSTLVLEGHDAGVLKVVLPHSFYCLQLLLGQGRTRKMIPHIQLRELNTPKSNSSQ